MKAFRSMAISYVVLVTAWVSLGTPSWATQPEVTSGAAIQVTWLDRTDGSGQDLLNHLAGYDNGLYAAAQGVSLDGTEHFVLRAYSEKNGTSKWISRYDAGFGANVANAVAGDSRTVFGAGRVQAEDGAQKIVTRACDRKTGAVLWSSELGFEDYANASSVATTGGRVFVAGTGQMDGADNMVVLAYDGKSGALLWQDAVNIGGGDASGNEVAASSAGVFAAGFLETADGEQVFVVRAYDPATGALRWKSETTRGPDSRAYEIAASADLVVAAGMGLNGAGEEKLLVEALDPRSGAVLWMDEGDDGQKSSAHGLVIRGDKIFVCGVSPGQYFLRAYGTKGGVLWEDSFDNMGVFEFQTGIDADGSRVAMVASNQTVQSDGTLGWELIVRAYKAENGVLLKDQRASGPGITGGVGVVLRGNRVFAAGEGSEDVARATRREAATTKVTVSGRDILVNGAKFFAKGVGYAPRPIGSAPGGPTFEAEYGDYSYTKRDGSGWQKIWQRDIPKLKEMGVNVVRVYGWHPYLFNSTHDAISHKAFLDALLQAGIYAVPEFYLESSDINGFNAGAWWSTVKGDEMQANFAADKDHPAVIGWIVGNELNSLAYNTQDYWSKYNGLVGLAKQQSPDKLTLIAVVDDSMGAVRSWDSTMTNLDVWGINSYRGRNGYAADPFASPASAFDQLFSTFKAASGKPLLLTEFGPPESTHDASGKAVLQPDNAKATADYLEIHWNRSPQHDDIVSNSDVCSGGMVFSWTDEWWKSGNPTQHDAGTSANGAYPGGWGDEEWHGIMGVEVQGRAPANFDQSHPDKLLPRAAFDRLKGLWATSN